MSFSQLMRMEGDLEGLLVIIWEISNHN